MFFRASRRFHKVISTRVMVWWYSGVVLFASLLLTVKSENMADRVNRGESLHCLFYTICVKELLVAACQV